MKTTKYVCKSCNAEFATPGEVYDSDRKTAGCPKCGHCGMAQKSDMRVSKTQLKQYLFLKREQLKNEEQLAKLCEQGKEDSELYELVENNRLRVLAQLIRTQSFIYSIDDSLTRQIFELRYINGLKWSGVATALGGYYSADYVRIMHDRYLKKSCLRDGS